MESSQNQWKTFQTGGSVSLSGLHTIMVSFVAARGGGDQASLQSRKGEQEDASLGRKHAQEAAESTQEAALPTRPVPATRKHVPELKPRTELSSRPTTLSAGLSCQSGRYSRFVEQQPKLIRIPESPKSHMTWTSPGALTSRSVPPEAAKRPGVHRCQPAAPYSHQAVHQGQQTNQQFGWCHRLGGGREHGQDDQAVSDQ